MYEIFFMLGVVFIIAAWLGYQVGYSEGYRAACATATENMETVISDLRCHVDSRESGC